MGEGKRGTGLGRGWKREVRRDSMSQQHRGQRALDCGARGSQGFLVPQDPSLSCRPSEVQVCLRVSRAWRSRGHAPPITHFPFLLPSQPPDLPTTPSPSHPWPPTSFPPLLLLGCSWPLPPLLLGLVREAHQPLTVTSLFLFWYLPIWTTRKFSLWSNRHVPSSRLELFRKSNPPLNKMAL